MADKFENAKLFIREIFHRRFNLDDRELRITISDHPSVVVKYREKKVSFSKNLVDSKFEHKIEEKLEELLG